MSVWSKLLTALRGGAHEAGEALVDSQALRILDQEIRDADDDLRQSREALAGIMAKEKLAQARLADTRSQIANNEGYATQALDQGDETLALEVAGRIATLEAQLGEEQQLADQLGNSASQLRDAINQAESHIRRLKQQADTVKATESVQRAQTAVAERYQGTDSRLQTALDSLERIKQQQAERSARLEAASEIARDSNGDSLNQRLRQAGILTETQSADSVLARLKARQNSQQAADN
ncbi:MAG: PspA/IM30 family protein [Gammaproteobacteria bacterium]|nr:PspA/IM30 family protein [Gammaproteobacteria bacterium]